MDTEQKTICVLVTAGPNGETAHTLFKIAQAAVALGHRVRVFFMHEGVYHIQHKNFKALSELDIEMALCASNALERGVEKKNGILFGSQYDLATMTAGSDAFLALD